MGLDPLPVVAAAPSWRGFEGGRDVKAALWPADYIRPGLSPDHCADVLAGSYDVPFNPATPPVIIDLGANVGAFVRWAAERWPGCTIHAYEPQPDNYALLVRTVEAMHGDGALINTHNAAVLNRGGRLQLVAGDYNCGEWSLFNQRTPRRGVVEVDVINAATLPRADILKIDTEGAELVIISALASAGRLPEFSAIMFEFHSDLHANIIPSILMHAGFVEVGRKVVSEHRGELKFMRSVLPK